MNRNPGKTSRPEEIPLGKGAAHSRLNVNNSDPLLLQKMKDGDPDAFRELFRRWERPLHTFLSKLTGSAADAEDISQDTFIKIWQHRSSIDPSKNFQTFTFHIAKQIFLNSRRREQYHQDFVVEAGLSEDVALSTEEIFEAWEMDMITEYHIGKLPPRTREVFMLHFVENLPNEQIAQRLGITPGNVKSHIHIARNKLRDVFVLLALAFLAGVT